MKDIIHNPYLAPHITWDAQRLSIFRKGRFRRFYDEPYTADAFWETQVGGLIVIYQYRIETHTRQTQLPRDGKPFGLILYADKTKLSTFGTATGYPVIARCANLPAYIRNGNGPGGGRLISWLPVVGTFFMIATDVSDDVEDQRGDYIS